MSTLSWSSLNRSRSGSKQLPCLSKWAILKLSRKLVPSGWWSCKTRSRWSSLWGPPLPGPNRRILSCVWMHGNSMEKPQLLLMQIMAIENDRNISVPVHIYVCVFVCVYEYRSIVYYRNYQRGPKLLAELLKPAEAPISRPRRPNILSDR